MVGGARFHDCYIRVLLLFFFRCLDGPNKKTVGQSFVNSLLEGGINRENRVLGRLLLLNRCVYKNHRTAPLPRGFLHSREK